MAPLIKYVNVNLLNSLNFNYGEPSMLFSIGKGNCTLYLSNFASVWTSKKLYIAIINKRWKNRKEEWYFGTMETPESEQDPLSGVSDESARKIMAIAIRKNRIAGRDIEKKLEELRDELFK